VRFQDLHIAFSHLFVHGTRSVFATQKLDHEHA
jgi:hypothetical protein